MDFAINAKPLERYVPSDTKSFNYKVWKLVVSPGFEYFVLILIALNTIILMMKVCAFLFRNQKNLFFF
jgi:voltage-dependent calcium channel N type alpha-1B